MPSTQCNSAQRLRLAVFFQTYFRIAYSLLATRCSPEWDCVALMLTVCNSNHNMLHTGACANAALLIYLQQTRIYVASSQKYTHIHDYFVLATLESIYFTLHYIRNKHHCNWNLFPALTFHISKAILWRRSFHKTRTCHRRSDSHRAGKASFLSISVGKVSYSWAVYHENPPSFSWVEDWESTMGHTYSSPQLT